jgi:hypothetical protein
VDAAGAGLHGEGAERLERGLVAAVAQGQFVEQLGALGVLPVPGPQLLEGGADELPGTLGHVGADDQEPGRSAGDVDVGLGLPGPHTGDGGGVAGGDFGPLDAVGQAVAEECPGPLAGLTWEDVPAVADGGQGVREQGHFRSPRCLIG